MKICTADNNNFWGSLELEGNLLHTPARHRDKPSRCRATSPSVPSRSLPKLRSRTVLSPSGFASGPVTPSDPSRHLNSTISPTTPFSLPDACFSPSSYPIGFLIAAGHTLPSWTL
ncbi:hypothetical protein VTN00DRAFT_1051 [Thermoascus crustaceus]|uniref:uncharacterized protein n=1 Tax=Thermoascus crustaceus TaxID=5088 RepID=UPI003743E5D8